MTHKRKSKPCRKKRYDLIGAMLALATIDTTRSRAEQRIYYCRRCRAWHLTSQTKNTR